MSHRIVWNAHIFWCVLACFIAGCSKPRPDSEPTPYAEDVQMAHDLQAVEDLRNEITALKQVVDEQNTRIEKLERELTDLKAHLNPKVDSEKAKRQFPGAASGGWRKESNWKMVRDGMSERQVISILGTPTSSKDIGSFRTLFYRGEIPDSGFISGNVKFDDDRVWQVNKPVF